MLVEGVTYLTKELKDANRLPLDVRKVIANAVKESKNELDPMQLTGHGWKAFYIGLVANRVEELNTPKVPNLQKLYLKCLGVADVSTFWTASAQKINNFVTTRGEIAHTGRQSQYIQAWKLREFIELIEQTTVEHDGKFCDYLKTTSGSSIQPWRRTA